MLFPLWGSQPTKNIGRFEHGNEFLLDVRAINESLSFFDLARENVCDVLLGQDRVVTWFDFPPKT